MVVSRKRKFIFNTITSILNQILLIISGFILPRAMIGVYGSEVNGLISSITQFLGFISFMQAGVGAVFQAALYKPLSERNLKKVSEIYCSGQKFFRTIAVVFVFYTFFISIVYPYVTKTPFSERYIAFLVIVISLNLFTQYFFGLTNSLLLNADQKAYIPLIFQSIVTILNVVISIVLIYTEKSVLIVKLISNIIYLINPLGLTWYVKRKYNIDTHIKYDKEPIQQKWNGFAQHISAVIVDNTDIVILTLFSSLSNVSIYYVYYLVINSLKQLLISLTGGIQSLFGNMIAKKEITKLKKIFSCFEIIFGYVITFLYVCTTCLIVNFVKVYTKGVDDVNYIVPVFAIILTMAYAMFCYRTIYYTLIKAAGHFKETQFGAILEAILNVGISILCVIKYGLVGVAIGTLVAVSYRTIYCVWYLSKHIIYRKPKNFIKNIGFNLLIFLICYLLTKNIELINLTYTSWILNAIEVAIIVFIILTSGYLVLYRKQFQNIKRIIIGYIKR